MNNFTEEEVRAAKKTRDAIINGSISEELKSVYMAGEICMWDELRKSHPSPPAVPESDMTAEEFFNGEGGMFTLDFLTYEEQQTIYKAFDLFAAGKVRQAMLSAPVSAMEDLLNEYGMMVLKSISETMLNPNNLSKASLNDQAVIQAVGETILNFPLPDVAYLTK